ncbi:MAG: peptide chain release factor N(5)-glutamine methyltransferase [Elusimicrobia bacterium]|nr:peptide chain release factor N(5)-glutamine methyltransferase [Elusimicrobiota bacterium]
MRSKSCSSKNRCGNKVAAENNIRSMLAWAEGYLGEAGLQNAERDTEYIMCRILGMTRPQLYVDRNRPLAEREMDSFRLFIKKRSRRVPVEYLFGDTVFMGLEFRVTADTLIPRPETELMVEECMGFVEQGGVSDIIEIGTGCGNIAVSLAKLTDARVMTVDKSAKALKVARYNAFRHGVSGKIEFKKGSMFDTLGSRDKKRFEILIANPPYVAQRDYRSLQAEVRMEPRMALVAGRKGLKYISHILKRGPEYMRAGARLYVEIGYGQKKDIINIVDGIRDIAGYGFIKDYSGIDRIIYADIR